MSESNILKVPSVLIAGGSGLIGRYLTESLLAKGYKVCHLSRSHKKFEKVRVFIWDYEKGIIDPEAFNGIDYLINLAGANIAEKRWSAERKKEIINSRVESTRFLFKKIHESGTSLKAFISSSATGYYGSVTSDKIFSEDDPPANDFLGTTCRQWEEATSLFNSLDVRTVKIRTAIVLEKNDGALTKLMKPAKYGFLVQIGSGQQYMPWIHIEDLCNIYLKAIEDQKMTGSYNAVSPQHTTHKNFIRTLAGVLNRSVLFTPVPALILRTALGEMSDMILKGSRVSSQKLTDSGYSFKFENLNDALDDVSGNLAKTKNE